MTDPRTEAERIVNRCWDVAERYAETGKYCPGRTGAFKNLLKNEITELLRKLESSND